MVASGVLNNGRNGVCMTMTDEKIIELLSEIGLHCFMQVHCKYCRFYHAEADSAGEYCCVIRSLATKLSNVPSEWNMEEIERIIRL